MPNPEKVMVEEVAISPAVERVEEKRPEPWTEKVAPGVVVPMPMVEDAVTLIASVSIPPLRVEKASSPDEMEFQFRVRIEVIDPVVVGQSVLCLVEL